MGDPFAGEREAVVRRVELGAGTCQQFLGLLP